MANRDSLTMEKLDWHLLPMHMLEPVVRVLMAGRTKYGAWNWMSPPYFSKHVIYNSLQRHFTAMQGGEDNDAESGLPHLAHVICNAIFALHYERNLLWADSPEDMPVLLRDENYTYDPANDVKPTPVDDYFNAASRAQAILDKQDAVVEELEALEESIEESSDDYKDVEYIAEYHDINDTTAYMGQRQTMRSRALAAIKERAATLVPLAIVPMPGADA